MDTIPLIDLKAQYKTIQDEIMGPLREVLGNQRFILGPRVEAFEKEMAQVCQVRFAVGVASGTDALLISLRAMGIGPGHEVILPAYTFFATASTIVQVGAKPVFVDIDPNTYNIDPQAAPAALTEHTKAILPVHLFGQCADMDPILELAKKHDLMVLEDACQAVCATYGGRVSGSMGHAGTLSFYPSKNLGAYGDGGMILTQDQGLREAVRRLRVFGASAEGKDIGYNSRLDELQAAVLKIKLGHLPQWIKARKENASILDQGLKGTPVTTPVTNKNADHTYSNYVIRAPERDRLMKHLEAQGIGTAIYYTKPLHRLECFAEFIPHGFELPHTDQASKETLVLPVYPELGQKKLARIVKAVRDFYGV